MHQRAHRLDDVAVDGGAGDELRVLRALGLGGAAQDDLGYVAGGDVGQSPIAAEQALAMLQADDGVEAAALFGQDLKGVALDRLGQCEMVVGSAAERLAAFPLFEFFSRSSSSLPRRSVNATTFAVDGDREIELVIRRFERAVLALGPVD